MTEVILEGYSDDGVLITIDDQKEQIDCYCGQPLTVEVQDDDKGRFCLEVEYRTGFWSIMFSEAEYDMNRLPPHTIERHPEREYSQKAKVVTKNTPDVRVYDINNELLWQNTNLCPNCHQEMPEDEDE